MNSPSSFYPHDRVVQIPLRCPVRSGAELGLLSLRLSVSQSASLGASLLAPVCPIEKGIASFI